MDRACKAAGRQRRGWAWLFACGLALAWAGMATAAESPALPAAPAAASMPGAPAASGPLQAASPVAAPLPTEAYAQVANIRQVVLSPNGQRIAGLLNDGDSTLLFMREVTGRISKSPLIADNKLFSIGWVNWVGNDHLVVSVRFPSRRGYVPVIETRLLSLAWEGGEPINLVRSSPFDARRESAQLQDRVIDWLPQDGRHILIQMATDGGVLPAVFKVDVTTAQREMVQGPKRGVHHWITDASHRVRVGVRLDAEYREVMVCDPDGQNWRTLWRYKILSKEAVSPMGFGKNPNVLYVLADHQGRDAVFTVDLSTPELKRTLRLAHPALDVGGGLMRSAATGDVIGIRDDSDDGERAEIWDPKLRLLALAIDKALPERSNRLLSFSTDENRYLVYSSGNGIPGEYYLGDRSTGDLFLLAETRPQLPTTSLVGKRPVLIKARDGLPLRAYLTLPQGAWSARGRPMVVLPHGGPQSRDDMDFDSWTEFLAARGYVVLQVNFRGSAGYGHDFMEAGLQRWGLEMQDDLTDAVRWAVNTKVADPARVCIVGGSYGGYAALMGVVKTPELYRCAVSFAGVSDLIDLWNFKSDFIGGAEAMDRQMGNAWRDRERLRATSPALLADRIQAPVLLVHGTADRIVPFEQSEDMAKALRKAGKTYEFITLEEGDHHLSRNSHSLTFFKALEGFLAKYLAPARAADAPVASAPAAAVTP